MEQAYITHIKRSAITKAFRGGFAHKRPDELCADIIRGVVKDSGIDPNTIEDALIGCAMPEAEQGMNIARMAVLMAGLPEGVPGMTINRFCSSGLQTIASAANLIRSGAGHCFLAGGTESMSMVPMMGNKVVASGEVMDTHPEFYLGMGLTAENVADKYKVSRTEQDEFSLWSHKKSIAAIQGGLFKDEILPVDVKRRKLDKNGIVQEKTITIDTDEGARADTSVEALGKLRSVFKTGGSVTAGNSSQMSDGAAIALVVSETYLKKHNLTPMARFCGFQVAGVDPKIMGIGPVAAIPLACKQAGIEASSIERIELNEAFASQSIAVMKELKLDPSRVNPTGGAISLGHPLGATGAKLSASLLYGMKRDKQKYGMVTMCIGTGMGAAGIFENLA